MFNPEIIKKDGMYEAEEGCLSLLGGPRKCKRYILFCHTGFQIGF